MAKSAAIHMTRPKADKHFELPVSPARSMLERLTIAKIRRRPALAMVDMDWRSRKLATTKVMAETKMRPVSGLPQTIYSHLLDGFPAS